MKNNNITSIKTVLHAIGWGCIVILFTVASGVVCSVVPSIDSKEKIWIVQGIFSWLSLSCVYMYIRNNHKLKFSIIKGLNRDGVKTCLFFIPFILALLPMLIHGFAHENIKYFICSAFFALGVGVTEELYFRGIVVSILDKKFKTSTVIIISTLIFGLGHSAVAFSGMSGTLVLLTIVNALIFGWLSAEVLYFTKGLLPLMIFHFLFDYLSKIAPLDAKTEMYVDIVRGSLMLIFAGYLCVIRLKTIHVIENK